MLIMIIIPGVDIQEHSSLIEKQITCHFFLELAASPFKSSISDFIINHFVKYILSVECQQPCQDHSA
jgi:hypothetical protein